VSDKSFAKGKSEPKAEVYLSKGSANTKQGAESSNKRCYRHVPTSADSSRQRETIISISSALKGWQDIILQI